MFMQYVHDMVIPEKETAEAVSNVAAVCSLYPPLTVPCGATSIAAGVYAAGTEAANGNNRQFAVDLAPTVVSGTTDLIFKRARIVPDTVSNAIGVGAGFKTQYWTKRDNYIDRAGECQSVE